VPVVSTKLFAACDDAGFAGCTVNVVEQNYARELRERSAAADRHETGIVPEIYAGTPVAAALVTRG
jgi:galactokinase